MSFACHQNSGDDFFGCTSYFMPVEPEICPLEDNVPEIEKKKNNTIHYLPGEKLLIQLNKQKKKHTNNHIDVERITASLGKILPF